VIGEELGNSIFSGRQKVKVYRKRYHDHVIFALSAEYPLVTLPFDRKQIRYRKAVSNRAGPMNRIAAGTV
jgi:hypothetical protein